MYTIAVSVVYDHPMYTIRPDVLSMVGETGYGWGSSNQIKSPLFSYLFIYLFIYLFVSECKVCSCSVNQINILF